jgi:hypothetical protein
LGNSEWAQCKGFLQQACPHLVILHKNLEGNHALTLLF